MMFNINTEIANTLHGNKKLDAKLMVESLLSSLNCSCGREVSVKKLLTILNDQELIDNYSQYNAFRFDFVDFSNKRIYEFDGDQHFEHIDFFQETYQDFLSGRKRDLIKQRFAMEIEYDLVRVTGKLSVREFLNILKSSELRSGYSLFIKDKNFVSVKTRDLETDLSEFDVLKSQNNSLLQTISQQQAQIDQLTDKLEEYEFLLNARQESLNQSQKLNQEINSLIIEFLNEIKHKFMYIKLISDDYLYAEYQNWIIEKDLNLQYLVNSSNFKKLICDQMITLNYQAVLNNKGYRDRRSFNSRKKNTEDYFFYLYRD